MRPHGRTFVRRRPRTKVRVRLKGRPHGRTRGYFTSYFFVRVRPSQPCTRTKVRVRVRVRRPLTMLDFLYVVHVYDYKSTSLLYSDEP